MQATHNPASLPHTTPIDLAALIRFLPGARALELSAGTALGRLGEPKGRWHVLQTGALVSSRVAPSGRRAVTEILGPGDVIAVGVDLGSWSCAERVSPPDVRALVRSCVLSIAASEILPAVERDPESWAWAHRAMARRVAQVERSLARVLTLRVRDRVHELLRDLADAHGRQCRGGVRVDLPLSQDLIASMVGATRESVNRALRALEHEGAVRRLGRRYVLLGAPGAAGQSEEPST
jgi:CRP/FNR family cyclic AMP-dependent transcriptional regulator